MPSIPRPTREPDTLPGAEDVRHHRPKARPHHHHHRQQHPHARSLRPKTDGPLHYPSDDSDDQQPAAKRRKLSIRGGRQTTIDHHFAQSGAPNAPPNKVTLSQPGGHLEETINGVKHELDVDESDIVGLPTPRGTTPASNSIPPPPKPALAKKEEKRTLRSQDEGPRLKSELAVYFPNYEDVIFDAPKEEEFITVDTVFYVTDDTTKAKGEQTSPAKSSKDGKPSPSHRRRQGSTNGITSPTKPQRSASSQFNGSPSLNFDSISKNLPDHPEDPLTDEHFLKSHKRAERKEKQLRNIEKERAMHEKVQLDRLLEGLQGHDWLKVLGITGITDGEAKKFEPKRDYFIAEVKALVDKFRQWKEQEKQLKMRKEAQLAAAEESEEDGSVEPPSSEMNDSAAMQLQQETASALKQSFKIKLSSTKGKDRDRDNPGASSKSTPARPLPPPPPLVPEEPITSFYAKRHLRDAALGKARHGRSVTAFGHAVPELEEREFELPDEYVNADVLRANAREKRRRKRASIMDGNG